LLIGVLPALTSVAEVTEREVALQEYPCLGTRVADLRDAAGKEGQIAR